MADEKTTDYDGIADRILAKLRGASKSSEDLDDDPDLDSGKRGYVRVDRLRREIDRRKALEQQLAEVVPQVEGLKGGLAKLREDTAADLGRVTARHAEDIELIDLGMTDAIGRSALRAAWGGMPKADRGKSASEWWGGQIEATKAHYADPEKAEAPTLPRALQPYLPPKPEESGGGGQGDGGRRQQGAPPAGPGKPKQDGEGLGMLSPGIRAALGIGTDT